MPAKIHVIGIGDDGLEALPNTVRELITNAEVVLGTDRTLELVPKSKAERHPITSDLNALVATIEKAANKRVVMLLYGDPMFYGLARYVCDKLGKERFVVVPHVSSMQMAFARVMETWEEAYLTDLAKHPLDSVLEKIRTAQKVGLFTTDSCGPPQVAKALLDRRIDYFTAYVCENLGARDERVTRGKLAEIAAQKFDPLNVMVLVRDPDAPDRPRDAVGRRLFGNPDEAFLQSKPKLGLLTPAEVRAIALAQMDIAPSSIVWDIGAGSGSVSVEAAQMAHDGQVHAIEMDAEDHGLIQQNAERFGVANVNAVLGRAPEIFEELPDPDAVFVAGAGREVTRISQAAFKRLRPSGRLVVNTTSVDHLMELRETLKSSSADARVWMINLARGTDQLDRLSFEPLKPSFLLAVTKN
ncbi:MAG TPA: precorrin-6y C5,15-methyltransferase (decarboxylating) subunit CbiE [Lacipirellulaceae bacterium]|jgi:precorrin-6Y C5,15-methyltransferase (decarboxylating)|nr:precorrin-6y C5,15-methyltransferase (decarboxylating) subunit CbiE [Lacipirellulaceae bacterium]